MMFTAKDSGCEQTTKPQTILPTYFYSLQLSSWPGPSCSKLGSDNPGLVRDLNSDLKT